MRSYAVHKKISTWTLLFEQNLLNCSVQSAWKTLYRHARKWAVEIVWQHASKWKNNCCSIWKTSENKREHKFLYWLKHFRYSEKWFIGFFIVLAKKTTVAVGDLTKGGKYKRIKASKIKIHQSLVKIHQSSFIKITHKSNKTARIRAKPWMFRLPFKVYGAVITFKKFNEIKRKKKF